MSAQLGVSSWITRGVIPADVATFVLTPPARADESSWSSAGVSMYSIFVSFELRRSPSYEKKKNSLSLWIGPPKLPPNWRSLMPTRFCGAKSVQQLPSQLANLLNAFSPGSSYFIKPLPCQLFVPLFEI